MACSALSLRRLSWLSAKISQVGRANRFRESLKQNENASPSLRSALKRRMLISFLLCHVIPTSYKQQCESGTRTHTHTSLTVSINTHPYLPVDRVRASYFALSPSSHLPRKKKNRNQGPGVHLVNMTQLIFLFLWLSWYRRLLEAQPIH